MYSIQRFENTAHDTTVTVSNVSAVEVAPSAVTKNRQGLVVTNCDAAAQLYFKFDSGTVAPTVSTNNFHFQLAPGAEKTLMCSGSVRLYGLSSGATATSAQIVEIL